MKKIVWKNLSSGKKFGIAFSAVFFACVAPMVIVIPVVACADYHQPAIGTAIRPADGSKMEINSVATVDELASNLASQAIAAPTNGASLSLTEWTSFLQNTLAKRPTVLVNQVWYKLSSQQIANFQVLQAKPGSQAGSFVLSIAYNKITATLPVLFVAPFNVANKSPIKVIDGIQKNDAKLQTLQLWQATQTKNLL